MASSSESVFSDAFSGGAPARSTVLRRLLAPSFSDLLFISLMAWLFAAGNSGWVGLLVDGDTGWHIRTGEYILDSGHVPTRDLFSFSKPAGQWFAWEWLADVVFATLFRVSGLKGVVLLSGLLIAATGLLVFRRMMWHGANLFIALLISLLGVGTSSVHFLARPHVFTLFLLAITIWLLEHDRARPGRMVWLLVPITALWTNLHGGFMALIACLGLLAAGSAVEAWLAHAGPDRWSRPLRYGILTLACSVATLLNPYGYHLHQHIVAYLRSDWIRKVVQEFQSPAFRSENMFHFEVLMFGGVAVAAFLTSRRRIGEALWILFWIHQSLGSVRHIPVFVIVATPWIAAEVTHWWDAWVCGRGPRSLPGTLDGLAGEYAGGFRRTSAWVLAPLLILAPLQAPLKWPKDFPDVRFPVKMADRYGEQLTRERVFTSDQWADYLIFRFYPHQRVFFDGRSDFYGPEIGEQYIRAVQGHHDWDRILERHGFTLALCPVEWPVVSLLKRHAGWKLLTDDGKAALFVKVPAFVASKK
jgi:hypothetical protein